MPYPGFDLSRLKFERRPSAAGAARVEDQLPLETDVPEAGDESLAALGGGLVTARNQGGATIFLCDEDVLLSGTARHMIDLIEKGLLTHLAVSELAALYDWDVAHNGRSTLAHRSGNGSIVRSVVVESFVARLVNTTSHKAGLGEALGRVLAEEGCAHPGLSLLAQAWRWGVPVTVHPTIGGSLWSVAPSLDPAALAERCHCDFLVLANSAENLEQGLVYQFGWPTGAVAAFAAALALARSVASQFGRGINDFTAALLAGGPADGDSAPLDRTRDCGSLPEAVSVVASADDGRRRWIEAVPRRTIPSLRLAALRLAGWMD